MFFDARIISETTWGYPIVAGIHVLAMALFGGLVLLMRREPELSKWKWTGAFIIGFTGVLLYWAGAARYNQSTSFWIKMALLVLIALSVRNPKLSLALWAAVIFASRGIAFF
jgi:uncharacterized membrane protein